MKCLICKGELTPSTAYEYRGSIGCDQHIERVREAVDRGWVMDLADARRTEIVDITRYPS